MSKLPKQGARAQKPLKAGRSSGGNVRRARPSVGRQSTATSRRAPKPAYVLKGWYASEEAKRAFGSICQAVNEEGREIELLGTEDRPLLCLLDTDLVPQGKNEVEISIDEAKADWPAVTGAALCFGTVFRIRGKRVVRAVLRRHRTNRHGALKYRRPQIEDLSQTLSTFLEDFGHISKHLEDTTELIMKQLQGGLA